MTTGISIMIIAIVIASIVMVSVWFYLKNRKGSESDGTIVAPPSFEESQGESVHVDPIPQENEKIKPLFSVGDWIVDDEGFVLNIYEIMDEVYLCDYAAIPFKEQDRYHLWTINDAKDGDVLYYEGFAEIIFIFKGIGERNKVLFYCDCNAQCEGEPDFELAHDREYFGYAYENKTRPAKKDEVEYLMNVMNNAGYSWDTVKHEFTKLKQEEQSGDEKFLAMFDELVVYFNNVVTIYEGGYTYNYLLNLCNYAFDSNSDVIVNLRKNFPCVLDYYTNKEYGFALEKTCAWIFALVLVELVPEKRDAIYEMAYNYKETGSDVPTFGWSLKSDPNVGRMCAFAIVNTLYNLETMNDLRCEVGGKMLTYKNDISETFISIAKFLPPAPEPYVKGCENRKDTRYPCGIMYNEDAETHEYVSRYYSLETKDSEKLAATVEAIGNKEHHKEHLFGKPRTVNHPTLGTITIYPVFGKHNIGIEIPENGAIANLCYEVGKASSNNRQSQLEIEYGRRRPCMGEYDGTANPNPSERALVDFYIEDGDGHRTGYYEKNGDWIDDNGNHIGDFTTFYQNAVYANSYTSGHSAFIEGAAGALMRVIPNKALEIEYAKNTFANGRVICRYHWVSDTMVGRIVGTMMLPVMFATTNCDMKNKYRKALEEYDALINGSYNPEPVEKVNTSLSYVCGGYGSCHVDAGETSLNHYCNKECDRERHPFINVSQRVEFTIEGGGVTTANGKTSGTWEANTNYELVCPAVGENEEKVAVITMRNENGVRVLNYKLSRQGTHDDGTKQSTQSLT